jgi:replicative DNA helicase
MEAAAVDGVAGETLVSLANGRREAIRTMSENHRRVVAIDAGFLGQADARCVASRAPCQLLRIRLASGRSIRTTLNHRLLGSRRPVEACRLVRGEQIAIARIAKDPNTGKRWQDHELVLLGHLVGDGSYLSGQPLRYTTASEDNSEAVRNAAQMMGSEVKRYAGRGRWHQLLISGNGTRWQAQGVGRWLKGLGIYGERSFEKRLPSGVFELADDQLALLCRHLWATDGCITVRKADQRGPSRVFFASSSIGLANDVAALLLRFEIVARIRKSVKPGYRPCFSVDVSGAHQRTFLDKIGAFGPRAAPAAALRSALESKRSNTNVDTLPMHLLHVVRASMRERGVTFKQMFALRGVNGAPQTISYCPSRQLIEEYARVLNDEDLLDWAKSDLFWDRVVDIESEGAETVFNMHCDSRTWIGDGVLHARAAG